MGLLEIFYRCPGDISWVFFRYLMGVLEILISVREIFDGCPGDM